MNKEVRNITTMNLSIPLDLSMQLTRRVADLKEAGMQDVTKSGLLLRYAQQGLMMDQDGVSEPIEITNK